MKILILANLEDRHIAQIKAIAPEAELMVTTDRNKAVSLAPEAEIMVGWNLPREAIAQAPNLKWIHSTAAGVDQLLFPEILEREILVTTSSGIHAIPLCEHVFAMMLALSRRLHYAIRQQIHRRWDRRGSVGGELGGGTLGILGLGHIGVELAKRAVAFEMRVIGTKRTPSPVPFVERVLPPEGLDEVLMESDVVVIALPLTPQTRGLIGERELRLMKPTAFLINVGRGPIVQERALIRALREGWIAGAALDVFEQEPLPADSPLYDLENVILTPHVAGTSPRYMDRAIPLFCENLGRYLRGEPLLNVVDKKRGY
ncbi:MAG: D-2-hydroxyacid dehydrogenase [Armatimonadota bacterium]|nr:D-2-hydroxyacid dehydrogenase [Armatimonadota bacterium]